MKLGLLVGLVFAVGACNGAAYVQARDYDASASAHHTRGSMPHVRYCGIELESFNVTRPTKRPVKVKLPPAVAHVAEHFGRFHDCYVRPLEAGGPGNVTVCDVD